MNIYVAIDSSIRMAMNGPEITETKLNAVKEFLYCFIDGIDKSEADICLIGFDSKPKVICESVSSSNDLRSSNLISRKIIDHNGIPNFCALAELILLRQSNALNFELVIILEATSYFQIPTEFHLPCIVHFVGVTSNELCSSNLLSEFEAFSKDCEFEAGVINGNSSTSPPENLKNNNLKIKKKIEYESLQISTKNLTSIHSTAKILLEKFVSNKNAILYISPSYFIEVDLTPGLPTRPFAIFDEELLAKEIIIGSNELANDNEKNSDHFSTVTLQLLGFIKSTNFLLHLPSTSLLHAVKPKPSGTDLNFHNFHLLAEALGSEGQLGVFQLPNGEECIIRPLKNDTADSWLLCMQFYSSNYFKWISSSSLATESPAAEKTNSTEFKGISYKSSAQRSYWIDSHGLQTDFVKISRLLKRPDRIEQFYQEIQRVSLYAVASGYDSFSEVMANLLEKRCVNIPPQNKEHLINVVSALRKGGFKLIVKQQRT